MLMYLNELRQRLLATLIWFGLWFLISWWHARTILSFILTPALKVLPESSMLITTHVTTALYLPLKLAIDTALLACMPMLLWQLWRFIVPALYPSEQIAAKWFFIASSGLFISGMLVCFYGVLPFFFALSFHALPLYVKILPDVGSTVHFITHMLLIFGVCFELPILCVLLIQQKKITLMQLIMLRPYAIVGAFVLGMLLTPPDVLAQIMLALPLWALYELSLLACRWQLKNHKNS